MRLEKGAARSQILDAADALFYANGIRAVSVDAVADRAGVTKRTLYYHFRSKDELVTSYLEARHDATLARLTETVAAGGGDLAARIEALFAGLAKSVGRDDWQGCPFARSAAELVGEAGHAARAVAARHKSALEAWLKSAIGDAGLDKPNLRARQIMVLIDGAVTQMLIHRDPAYAKAAGRAASVLLRAGKPGRPKGKGKNR